MTILIERFLLSLFLTVVIETTIGLSLLSLLKIEHSKKFSIAIFVFINIFTLPIGYVLVNWIHMPWLVVEAGIIITEIGFIWKLFDTRIKQAVLISLFANGTTILLALILSAIF